MTDVIRKGDIPDHWDVAAIKASNPDEFDIQGRIAKARLNYEEADSLAQLANVAGDMDTILTDLDERE